jgi:uncharacterized protein (TIGR03083 family)
VSQLLSALRASHDQLAELADRLGPADLTRPSYASDWTVAQVYSHLGSGAEILMPGAATSRPERVWARWDAKTPAAMVRDFVEADERFLTAADTFDGATQLTFAGQPVDLATYLTLRLTEHALHNWDIRVAFDPRATLDPLAVPLLVGILMTGIGDIADREMAQRLGPAQVAISTVQPDGEYLLTVDDDVSLRPLDHSQGASGALALPTEALMRLATGRLDPDHTAAGTTSRGRPTLDDLRKLFPGY